MSEWVSVIVVYWALWALDGVKLAARRSFSLVRGGGNGRARLQYDRWLFPPFLPGNWRLIVSDPPLSFSADVVCNVPRGSAGRPAEVPAVIRVWRWNEIRHVGVAKGWLYINGQPFGPDTGHVSAREILELAQLTPAARAGRLDAILGRWFRPATLRRRARVIAARTAAVAACNAAALVIAAAVSLYVVADVASLLGESLAANVARFVPLALAVVLVHHIAGVSLAWRALRRLRSINGHRGGASLASAFLLPPQAMKLRALLADGCFPAQHPLAAIMAFGTREQQAAHAFNALADLRWPAAPGELSAGAAEAMSWFGRALESHIERLLREAGMSARELLQAPAPDSPASCRYCPRCRDQFTAVPAKCPHGVALLPLDHMAAGRGRMEIAE